MSREVIMDEAMIAALEEIDREFPNTPPVAPPRSMLYEIREDQRRRWLLGIRGGRPPGPDAAAQLANAGQQNAAAAQLANQQAGQQNANQQVWRNPATLVGDADLGAMEKLMRRHGR